MKNKRCSSLMILANCDKETHGHVVIPPETFEAIRDVALGAVRDMAQETKFADFGTRRRFSESCLNIIKRMNARLSHGKDS